MRLKSTFCQFTPHFPLSTGYLPYWWNTHESPDPMTSTEPGFIGLLAVEGGSLDPGGCGIAPAELL